MSGDTDMKLSVSCGLSYILPVYYREKNNLTVTQLGGSINDEALWVYNFEEYIKL